MEAGANKSIRSPLTEVVLGATFAAPNFTAVEYGLFFERVRTQYPNVSSHPPIISASDISLPIFVPPMLRVWFEAENEQHVVQLQSDRLIYNWKRVRGLGTYPRFPACFDAFLSAWGKFQAVASERHAIAPQLQQFEFSYINNITADFISAVDKPVFKWESAKWSRFLPEPTTRMVQYVFDFPSENVRIRATTRPAIEISSGHSILAFQIEASSIRAVPSLEEWFPVGHRIAEASFRDLLTPEALALWEQVEP